jgi:two-component system, chemotaxis family, chemotaxis protein CheY
MGLVQDSVVGERLQRGLRVLLIDDHLHVRSLLNGILGHLGVDHITSLDRAETALKQMSHESFDAVITDYEMPGMNGLEFVSRVREEGRSACPKYNFAVPIIMVTSHATQTRLDQARSAGVDEFLVKPFTTKAVNERVEAALFRRRPFVQSQTYIGPCRRRGLPANNSIERRQLATVDQSLPVDQVAVQADPRQDIRLEARKLLQQVQAVRQDVVGVEYAILAHSDLILRNARLINAPLIERTAASLAAYVETARTVGSLDSEVVEVHGLAVMQLLTLGPENDALSKNVVAGLERTIAKSKTRRKAA